MSLRIHPECDRCRFQPDNPRRTAKGQRCQRCSPGKGCNSHGKRRPRPDQHKDKRKGKR